MLDLTNINLGILNELVIIRAINGKKVKDVNFLFQELFYDFFKDISPDDYIKAYKGFEFEKTDVVVEIDKKIMNISVKFGFRNSVHCENIYYFLKFLKSLKIPSFIINEYLYYHYADGTMNNTGSYRMSALEYKEKYQNKIDFVNKYFNNKKIMREIANRFVFKGTKEENRLVDVILLGKADDFFWCYRDEVFEYLNNSCDLYMTCPHFGRLSVQPSSRCLNRSETGERRRKQVGIKWYNIFDSIIEIMNNRVSKKLDRSFHKYCKKLNKDILDGKYEDICNI